MAKIVNPVLFSNFFNIDLEQFELLGVFNPTLNVDTKLFIDPLLIENSSIDLINKITRQAGQPDGVKHGGLMEKFVWRRSSS